MYLGNNSSDIPKYYRYIIHNKEPSLKRYRRNKMFIEKKFVGAKLEFK